MIDAPIAKASATDWSDALLTSGTEALLGAVRNYVGPIRTPYDKRELVRKLQAFLRREETRAGILALVDALDARILGSSILLGPVPEQVLKELFVGELPLFELGLRISNLVDRLLLFRYQSGTRRLIAVNPLLEAGLRPLVLAPESFFGSSGEAPLPLGAELGTRGEGAIDARAAVALFCFLVHSPSSIRKGGALTKKAAEKAASLLPELASAPGDRLSLLARALAGSGALVAGQDEERCPDPLAFSTLLRDWGGDLPYYLAACLGTGDVGEAASRAFVLASALEALPEQWALPRAALARWLRIAAWRVGLASGPEIGDPAPAIRALEAFGLLVPSGRCLGRGSKARTKEEASGPATRRLVAEGSHALHLMPEAGLEDRLFVGSIARPVATGTVWSFEVERDTVRRAFAAGLSASGIGLRLEAMAGSPLPQSLAFSLEAWEEEFRSLRLYRGYVLAADERQRLLIEGSPRFGSLVRERLGPGIYLLAAEGPEEAAAALAAAGLEAPPITVPPTTAPPLAAAGPRLGRREGEAPHSAREVIDALRDIAVSGEFPASGMGRPGQPSRPSLDPEPRLIELRASLASSRRSEEERRELAERIERRLVVTEAQIASADPKSERLEAGGLDYLGKVRVVERALRGQGDRLEVLYRLPGEEPVRALLRPVRLDKNEKGLVLEAEDLATGGPARVPLGALSTVRRLRASLFGEEQ